MAAPILTAVSAIRDGSSPGEATIRRAGSFKTANAGFSANPAARLQWLYERTPFYDPHALLYPVGREE
jgi:hypothetical protein